MQVSTLLRVRVSTAKISSPAPLPLLYVGLKILDFYLLYLSFLILEFSLIFYTVGSN